ncbi:MAG: hypothetical protein J4F46_09280, partial [Dehalococcoidia bacterium]|nr:hypothetical protein [Dehalococcoidia bacterium]
GTRQMSEAALVDGYSKIKSIESNGLDIHNSRNKSLTQQIGSNAGVIVGAIFIVIGIFAMLQCQSGEPMWGTEDKPTAQTEASVP